MSTQPEPAHDKRWEYESLDVTQATKDEMAAYVKYKQWVWAGWVVLDGDLWELFGGEFEDWTEKHFEMLGHELCDNLRTYLRSGGVWIRKYNKKFTLPRVLFDCVQEDAGTWDWPEIDSFLLKYDKFTSKRINRLLQQRSESVLYKLPTPEVPTAFDHDWRLDQAISAARNQADDDNCFIRASQQPRSYVPPHMRPPMG